MIASLILGIVFLTLVVVRLVLRERDTVPGLLLVFAGVWGVALLALCAVSPHLDFSSRGLLVSVGPLAVVTWLAWPVLLRPVSRVPWTLDRVTVIFFWFAFVSTFVVVVFEVTGTVALIREVGLGLALPTARASRQAGSFYPALVTPLNSARLFLAPLAWTLLSVPVLGWKRHVAWLGLGIGLVSLLLTTARAPFVLTLMWLMGISYWRRSGEWGLGGIAIRLGAVVALGVAFFVGYGMILGKTGRAVAEYLRGGESSAPVLSGFMNLLVYAIGPLAALANSTESVLSEAFRGNLLYPLLRVGQLVGVPAPDLTRSLPYVNIPFPINTYTFLGPAFWYGGLAGSVAYLCIVLGALVWLERVAPSRLATTPLLFGFFFAAVPMSLSSDYFLSAGFAHLLYAYALAALAYRRLRSR